MATSGSVAPILLIRTKPLMPKVEGNIHETTFQNSGMAEPGHEMPEMNSNGTEVNTYIIMQASRWWIKIEQVIAKKMHANI